MVVVCPVSSLHVYRPVSPVARGSKVTMLVVVDPTVIEGPIVILSEGTRGLPSGPVQLIVAPAIPMVQVIV